MPRFFLLLFLVGLGGCNKKTPYTFKQESSSSDFFAKSKNTDVLFVAQNGKIPSHIVFKQVTKVQLKNANHSMPFSQNFLISPTMRLVNYSANVYKDGKIDRSISAQRIAKPIIGSNQTVWTQRQNILSIKIPFVAPNEEIEIIKSYQWMDYRWMRPIFLDDEYDVESAKVRVDVPYGTTLFFQASAKKELLELKPESLPVENKLWSKNNLGTGLGSRYVFRKQENLLLPPNAVKSDWQQLFLSFEPMDRPENLLSLDSWSSVAKYLYNRMRFYDIGNNAIHETVARITADQNTLTKKAMAILQFIASEIELRKEYAPIFEQELQPSTKTFRKKSGSSYDIVILAKAMLSSLGVRSNILAVSERAINPDLVRPYTPALLSRLILSIGLDSKTLFYDPLHPEINLDQISPSIQGQKALALGQEEAEFFYLPLDPANKHQESIEYELFVDAEGIISGNFSHAYSGLVGRRYKEKVNPKHFQNPYKLQQDIFRNQTPFLSWQKVSSHSANQNNQFYNLQGSFTSRIMPRNSQNQLSFKLNKFLQEALLALKSLPRSENSQQFKMRINVNLPEQYQLAQKIEPFYFQNGPLDIRCDAKMRENQLVLEVLASMNIGVKRSLTTKGEFDAMLTSWFEKDLTLSPIVQVENTTKELTDESSATTEKDS